MKLFIFLALAVASYPYRALSQLAPPDQGFNPGNQVAGGPPANRVTISVGEKTGNFIYTANGITYDPQKITASGEYFNNDFTRFGFARIYLTVETGVYYWEAHPAPTAPNRLNVYIENYYQDAFYFEVICPYPVRAQFDLDVYKFNETTILVEGPPKSHFY